MRHGVLRNNKGIIIHNVVHRLQRRSPFSHGKEKLNKKGRVTTPQGVLHAIDRIAKKPCSVRWESKRVMHVEAN